MKTPATLILTSTLALSAAATSFAATSPDGKHSLPSTPRTVVMLDTDSPPVVRAGLLQSTLIMLPPEEKVATVFGGDTVSWVFDGGHVASRFISIKPKVANSTTDVHIVSDHGNEYTLQLREVAPAYFQRRARLCLGWWITTIRLRGRWMSSAGLRGSLKSCRRLAFLAIRILKSPSPTPSTLIQTAHPTRRCNTSSRLIWTRCRERLNPCSAPLSIRRLSILHTRTCHDTGWWSSLLDFVMDKASASALRDFVSAGGTVLMTALSAKLNENGLWFDTPLPGGLSDVFGLKTNAFYDNTLPLIANIDGAQVSLGLQRYEVLEPSSAKTVFSFTNTRERSPYLTVNKFGKGNALYVATPASAASMASALPYAQQLAAVTNGPKTPAGVFARVVEGRTLYVNTTGKEVVIDLPGTHIGRISGHTLADHLKLATMDAELVQ